MPGVVLPPNLIVRLADLAGADARHEVCGLLGRRSDGLRLYSIDNVDPEPERRFLLDGRQQIDAFQTMRKRDETLFAIFHSHPRGAAYPSGTDLEQAAYPGVLYLILAPAGRDAWDLEGFYLNDGTARRVELSVSRSRLLQP